jgi:hypothetical protein
VGFAFLVEVIMILAVTSIMSSMDMVCPRHDSACIHVQLYFVYYVSQFKLYCKFATEN